MFAIAFDLKIEDLKKNYGEPYNGAYYDIKKILREQGFSWCQGSVYICEEERVTLLDVYKAIDTLSAKEWFRTSVRNVKAFRVEEWSDLTKRAKGE